MRSEIEALASLPAPAEGVGGLLAFLRAVDDAEWADDAKPFADYKETFGNIREWIALLSRLEGGEREGWRPIESAPKDGRRIIIDFGKAGIHAVTWEESVSGIVIWCVDDQKHGPYPLRGYNDEDIRGWMPLPAAPVKEPTP